MAARPSTLAYAVPWGAAALLAALFLAFGPVAFAAPWALLALIVLPALWFLLRVLPPTPRLIRFPPIRLLLGLDAEEQTPQTTPLWLILLRVTISALVILACAGPLVNPAARLPGSGPLLLVVDDSWAAALGWDARREALTTLLDQAERDDRQVALFTTVPRTGDDAGPSGELVAGREARAAALALEPQPLPADHARTAAAVRDLEMERNGHVVWLADGLQRAGSAELVEALARRGSVEVRTDPSGGGALLLRVPRREGPGLTLVAERRAPGPRREIVVRALAADGRLLARQTLAFDAGGTTAEALLDVPLELRNRLGRLVVEGEGTAGGVVLLDERARRRPIGLVARGAADSVTPLLDPFYYLQRAMQPYAELSRGPATDLLQRGQAMLVFVDEGPAPGPEAEAVQEWMEDGGLVLRFAGPQTARADAGAPGTDRFLPVTLRRGGRALGGALLWGEPASLAPFEDGSPFAGLAVPDDVTVSQQVLAEPSLDLAEKTWARLSDGTPLVTAERRGEGWLVLIHTTADTEWSNLPLSGLFVGILQRLAALGEGVSATADDVPLAPDRILDGFGQLATPPAGVRPISAAAIAAGEVGPDTPPGYYGRDASRRALNLAPAIPELAALGALPARFETSTYARGGEFDLRPWLFAAALALFLIDAVVGLALRGLLPRPGRWTARLGRAAPAVLIAVLAVAPLDRVAAQTASADDKALAAALTTRIAYVMTGVPALDDVSRQGLSGLSRVLTRRTAVEPGEPIGIDPARDELAFYPLLYWPIDRQQPPLSAAAIANLAAYMKNGGTIFFDTRDGEVDGAGARRLRELARRLSIPPLQPVPRDHVLTKSFYLIQEFPGRWASGDLWLEPRAERVNDGVSSVIVGSNDYAAAWALDELGRPRFAVVPGGELQREMAFRVGVNLMMYALTGSYKSDQVHVPSILERLGQ